ncbi:MAG: ribonucleoside-diphosphate reductase subunit alpha [Lentisphaeria bacterium]
MIKSQSDTQLQLAGLDPLQNHEFKIRKRDGRMDVFQDSRIYRAIEKAFKAATDLDEALALPESDQKNAQRIADSVSQEVVGFAVRGGNLDVEWIQDVVEQQLMSEGFFNVARRYILYREERKKARVLADDGTTQGPVTMTVTKPDGSIEKLDPERIRKIVYEACKGLDETSAQDLNGEVMRMLYDGITTEEIDKALILAAKSRIEIEPSYSYAAARLLLQIIYRESLGVDCQQLELEVIHRRHFKDYLDEGIAADRLSPELLKYDLEKIAAAIELSRDHKFAYIGLQTIYDRYLLHIEGRRIETPQYFWMRVAMGLAMQEEDREARAIEFYNVLSTFHFVSSTPTLFNAGTLHQQLSSCYLSTVMDELEHIFKVVSDDASLSKWAGGLGNDWSNVRATGAHIKGTNGESQGVIPFLKVANDTAVAVNQGGKRKGAMCAYLETWHLDIEDFLELRKNTGDERRRTPDMNTANWIPDLFMKRVAEGGHWTLFSPSDVPDLHDLYGKAFEKRYIEYETMAANDQLKHHRRIEAVQLWRKMLSMLFETGHPWLTFKDPSNLRSPQGHTGVVHSSNLCTEILLNTSRDETAVCNLGSINLAAHVIDGHLDEKVLSATVRTAIRMLDNVIDINYYPTPEARTANMRHRPIGLGLMGFQDALYKLGFSYASDDAVTLADRSMEMISYYAILASAGLAAERGTYETYEGSKWSCGQLPIDTIELLQRERGGYLDIDRGVTMDWSVVREAVRTHGMRNSNTMAIAPTATISNIVGVGQSIEPTYNNLFVKSNLSGEFTTVNNHLIADLKKEGLWDKDMLDDLKYFDGVIQEIERIPEDIKQRYLTAFEIDSTWLIQCASRRQKWIDMGQSLNLYLREPSGKKLSDMYMHAWQAGLKTTYYLRTLAATQIEKSTVDINRRGVQPRWMKNRSASAEIDINRQPKACSILDPDCDACQ